MMKSWRKHGTRWSRHGLMWGNLFGSGSLTQSLVSETRHDIESGLDAEAVRAGIRQRCEKEGVAGVKATFPELSRKLLRKPVRIVLHEAADFLANLLRGQKVGDATAMVCEAIGWDKWLEDYIYSYAATGEPGEVFEPFRGTVVSFDVGDSEEPWPIVVAIGTRASDVVELVAMFEQECWSTFPSETLARKRSTGVEAAVHLRRHAEGVPYSQMAHETVQKAEPDLLASDDDEQFRSYDPKVATQTERIRKHARRIREHRDTILDLKSQESE